MCIYPVTNAKNIYNGEMINKLEIRESGPSDIAGIEQLYADSFPDENLIPLVRELLDLEEGVISLVGVIEGRIVGHISFTFCHVEGGAKVALLAPLAVAPALHKQGVGSQLVIAGFRYLKNAGTGYVCVFGDPAYYSRFGFKPEYKITTPYPLPEEWSDAWQSVQLIDAAEVGEGKLSVPEPWRYSELWGP